MSSETADLGWLWVLFLSRRSLCFCLVLSFRSTYRCGRGLGVDLFSKNALVIIIIVLVVDQASLGIFLFEFEYCLVFD